MTEQYYLQDFIERIATVGSLKQTLKQLTNPPTNLIENFLLTLKRHPFEEHNN